MRKISWKTIDISLYGLVQRRNGDAVQFRQIDIEHNSLPTHYINQPTDTFDVDFRDR